MKWDNIGMYLVLTSSCIYSIETWRIFSQKSLAKEEQQPSKISLASRGYTRRMVITFIVSNVIIIYIITSFPPHSRRPLFFVVGLITLIAELKARKFREHKGNFKFLVFSIISILVGVIMWILDNEKILCDPMSVFQGPSHFFSSL